MQKNTAADFSYLDSTDLRGRYAGGTSNNRISFYVDGIKCGACVRTIEALPHKTPGLLSLTVDLANKTAHAEIDPRGTDLKSVAQAIADAGFNPLPLTKEMTADDLQTRSERRELIRLAVAAACAGNIMSFAFANYFGAGAEFATLFSWISFVLYLPVVTYVAWPFYHGAYFALRNRRLSIDLPMAVASFAGFLFSTAELLRGRDDVYFDSLAGFLFLILLSRWAQRRMQKTFLQSRDIMDTLQLLRARKVQATSWTWMPEDQLRENDMVLIYSGETVPADCELSDPSAAFSLAFLSGEAIPKTFTKGGLVPAGAKLLSSEAKLAVKRPLRETAFGKLLAETREISLKDNQSIQVSDRLAQWLLLTVMSVALGFLILYWPTSPEEAVRRALALIIIACPCAMAFGTPLAIASAIRKAQQLGILVRDGRILEAAGQVKTIFLDKTGTVTDADLSLVEPVQSISGIEQMIVLALERKSLHPIAFAFRKAFKTPKVELAVQAFREIPGKGVEGMVGGSYYQLLRAKEHAGEMACMLTRNGREFRTYHFQSRPKPDAFAAISELRNSGVKVILLSGDSQSSAEKLGWDLGFNLAHEVKGGFSPEDKARIVGGTPHAMMVGDGINDALALKAASVGVAVSGGVEAAFRSAQVILTDSGLKGLSNLMSLSRMARQSIRINLAVSLIYNVCAGTLALAGAINPYVAAVLMPVSSGLILATTWLRSRV